jgi:hypothetical protein
MIDQSLRDDDTDDDDVRLEAHATRTLQPYPCECLINVGTQFEESVGADLAKPKHYAQARYHLWIPELDENEQNASKVRATTNISATNDAPPEEVTRSR